MTYEIRMLSSIAVYLMKHDISNSMRSHGSVDSQLVIFSPWLYQGSSMADRLGLSSQLQDGCSSSKHQLSSQQRLEAGREKIPSLCSFLRISKISRSTLSRSELSHAHSYTNHWQDWGNLPLLAQWFLVNDSQTVCTRITWELIKTQIGGPYL